MTRKVFVVSLLLLAVATASLLADSNHRRQATTPAQAQQPNVQNPAPAVNFSTLSPAELEQRGDTYRAQKDYGNAVDCYRAAIKKQPMATLYNKLGMAYIGMLKPAEARKEFERAVKLEPQNADIWNNIAVTFYLQHKYSTAIKRFHKSLELNPDLAAAHSSLGTTYMELKDYKNAVAEYRRALELDPDIFEHSSTYGVTGKLTRPEDQARFDFEMARLFATVGDFERALKSLRRAMEEGYPDINAVYKDKEFDKLRADERFTALMKEKPVPLPAQ